MSAWATPAERDTLAYIEGRRADPEDLVTEIANALATAGEYATQIALEPTQRVVDFNWAARQAGRRLGIRVDIDMTITKSSEGQGLVRVTALRPPN